MRIDIRQSWIRRLMAVLLVGLFAAATIGCEKTPEEKLRAAKGAVVNQKADQAKELLEAVLSADPDNTEAKRLMGRVHKLEGNFAKAEEELQGLWNSQGFADEQADLSTQQKSQKERLEDDFTNLYQAWAVSLDASENPEKFEEVAQKGLEFDAKKPRLNSMLVDFYESRAKTLVDEGKKLEAAEAYEGIINLRTLPKKRDNAEERAADLRFEVNKEEMLGYFNDEAKANFEEQELYDEENEAILFGFQSPRDAEMESSVEEALEESRDEEVDLDRNNAQHAAVICDVAMREQLAPALEKVIVEATGISEDSDFSKMRVPASVTEGVKIGADRRNCGLEVTLPLEDVLKMGFEVKEQTRKAQEDASEDEEADAAPAGAKAEAEQAGEQE